MEIICRIYKPRRARESPLFRLVEQHFEELLQVWPTRFARQHGPLRPVVERVLRGFMRCGLVEHGFARLWCPTCRTSVLCPFSCRGRSFCPSGLSPPEKPPPEIRDVVRVPLEVIERGLDSMERDLSRR